MVGVRSQLRYALVMSSGGSEVRCEILCDADHTTLTVGGTSNAQASVLTAANTLRFLIPVFGSPRGSNVCARAVVCSFTGALPAGRSGSTIRIPVFRVANYNAISVGNVGTYLGLPIRVELKFPGRPGITGGFS